MADRSTTAQQPQRFGALRRFLSGSAGGGEGDADEGQDGEDEEGDGDGQQQDGEGAGTDQQDGGDGDGGEQQDGEGEEGAGEEGEQGADAQASFGRGRMAERRRWARVLTHANAEGRLELATSMLADNLSADAIIRHLGSAGRDGGSRLSSTPRHNLGARPNGEGRSGDAGAASRKRALSGVNAGGGRGQKVTSGNKRVQAAGGGAPKSQED